MNNPLHLAASALIVLSAPAFAGKTHTEQIKFAAGKSSATLSGKVTGSDTMLDKLHAKDKQFLRVSLTTDNEASDFNLYIPGRAPGDEALFNSAIGGRAENRRNKNKKQPTTMKAISLILTTAGAIISLASCEK